MDAARLPGRIGDRVEAPVAFRGDDDGVPVVRESVVVHAVAEDVPLVVVRRHLLHADVLVVVGRHPAETEQRHLPAAELLAVDRQEPLDLELDRAARQIGIGGEDEVQAAVLRRLEPRAVEVAPDDDPTGAFGLGGVGQTQTKQLGAVAFDGVADRRPDRQDRHPHGHPHSTTSTATCEGYTRGKQQSRNVKRVSGSGRSRQRYLPFSFFRSPSTGIQFSSRVFHTWR